MKLANIPTTPPKGSNKEKIKAKTKKLIEKMAELQHMMYAQKKYSLLIIFQGMDGSGKDSAIKAVFSGLNPLGCNAIAFGKPNTQEAAHDFLRRIHQHTPAKGMVQIFNRSYYEDILVPSVEKSLPKEVIQNRYEDINNFEKLLMDNDTVLVKFFLHISHKKQEQRLKERLLYEHKFWKFDAADLRARAQRDVYQKVYEKIFEKCNIIPRHIVPADKNWYKNYIVAKTIVDAFKNKMKLARPDLDPGEEIYRQLHITEIPKTNKNT